MPQIFARPFNTVARVSIGAVVLLLGGAGASAYQLVRSPYVTKVRLVREQPVPFSHKHHVGDIGIDCRYCHTSVEESAFAGMPATEICMNCHSQLWKESPMLEPVRESYRTGKSLEWLRVHDLPDFAYFNHSIHVKKGVGCVTCHGRVDQMPLMWKENTLQMEWCVGCHRDPQAAIRPPEEVFHLDWKPPPNFAEQAAELMKRQNIRSKTDCYTCHR